MRYNSILDTIGNTPCVRLHKLGPKHVNLYVKLEQFNPMSSVKDRMALGLIEKAERTQQLKPGQTVIEATSGNAGIGLAMVCAQKGYPFVAVIPENFSVERRQIMRFMGAQVVLTPAEYRGLGALQKAQELALRHGWFYCQQFENEDNANTHARTTAREILRDFADLPLDYWVTGYGTGGTLKGVANTLKKFSVDTKVVVCEPNNSQLLASTEHQPRNHDGTASMSHPQYRPHIMQGWSPDFISKLTDEAQKEAYIDILLAVDGVESLKLTRKLATQEGIFTGISGGATLAGALKLAEVAEPGSTILCMLPDSGERYLSTPMFDDIEEGMNEQELKISESTPNFVFEDLSPLPMMEVDEEEPLVSDVSITMFNKFINNPKQPVVMFGLEWCEFCWSVRKLFKNLSIEFHAVDIDSFSYRTGELGDKLKATLVAHTGCNTLPQVFINGTFIGSCTEIFDAVNSRKLFTQLKAANVSFNSVVDIDPYALLPGWMHTRKSDDNESPEKTPKSKALTHEQ